MVRAGIDTIKPRVVGCGEKSGVSGTVKIGVTVTAEGVVSSAEVKALETQVGELEQTLAETEDALSAAREETEKYRALYEELAGEESGTP